MSVNSQLLIVLALIVSSAIALTLTAGRLAPPVKKASFREFVELRERLYSDKSIFLNFEVEVIAEEHVVEVCVENGCRRIVVTETWIVAPVDSSPCIPVENFERRKELYSLYSNGTHTAICTGVYIEAEGDEVIITYVKPVCTGVTHKLVLYEERIDEIVVYVQEASILIDGGKVAVFSGFKKIRIRQVTLTF